ncbi:MAG: retroviral-like aspartic protease family protein [Chloroflexi bacterium]|nr:retroviral-like aspartic protease family protein [Chloroflexota bacterium]
MGLLQSMAQALIQQGDQVPAPRTGLALIDTGASDTCIDEQVAKELGLPVVDQVNMASASNAAIIRNVYPITIEITGLPNPINAPRAIGAELAPQGLLLLVGRDALRFCTLFYNGITGELTLSI